LLGENPWFLISPLVKTKGSLAKEGTRVAREE